MVIVSLRAPAIAALALGLYWWSPAEGVLDIVGTRRSSLRRSVTHAGRLETFVFRARNQNAPDVLFTHLLKAGGTRIKELLEQLLEDPGQSADRNNNLYVHQNSVFARSAEEEAAAYQRLRAATASGNLSTTYARLFRIGLARNPCDYLVSMWAFQSSWSPTAGDDRGHGEWPHKCLQKMHPTENVEAKYYGKDFDQALGTEEDKQRFRAWVRASAGSRLHYFGYRSYIAGQHDAATFKEEPVWDDGQYFACLGQLRPDEEDHIARELARMQVDHRYECMVYTEALETSLQRCMYKYLEHVEDPLYRHELEARMDAHDWTTRHTNPSKHATCAEYFDENTTKFVWKREGPYASRLGYDSCCGMPNHI